jgi:hypothetical protein
LVVVEGGQLHPGHVLQAHHGRGRLLDQDVGELVGIGKPAERLHRHLEGAWLIDRRLAEHARRDLDVLALQGRDDVPRRQPERLQAVGIEPDAHGIVAAAEHGDRATPLMRLRTSMTRRLA